MQRIVAVAYAVLFGVATVCSAGAPDQPDALIKSVIGETIAALRADKDIRAGSREKLVTLINEKVAPHCDFARMTRIALGKYWRDASLEEREAVAREFRTLLIGTYAALFLTHQGQAAEYEIRYKPFRVSAGDDEATVRSTVRRTGGTALAVDYRLEKTDRGWKVYDVAIDGVSLVQAYRDTFASEIRKGGIRGLIAALEEKNKKSARQK